MKKSVFTAILAVLALLTFPFVAGAVEYGHGSDAGLEEDSGIIQGHIVDGVLADDGNSPTVAPPPMPDALSFTVRFYPNGGSVDKDSKLVTNGRAYGELPTPKRDGYSFDGWRTVEGVLVTANKVVNLNGDLNLYAYWSVATYSVTLDPNGGTVGVGTLEVVHGGTYGGLPVPTRNGYSFDGWFTQWKGGQRVRNSSKLAAAGDHTLYAHWTALPSADMQDYSSGELAFRDVPSDSSYYQAVYWAVKRGITSGTSYETFSPNDPCIQRHILTFLWRANGSPEPVSAFPGVDSSWTKGAMWACEKGLISLDAYNDEQGATRSDAVTYLWKLAGCPKDQRALNAVLQRFTDVQPDSDYALAVAWALNVGITNGTTDTTFSPERICTRGQIVTFLYRCYTL